MNQIEKENHKMIIYIDGSVITRKKTLPVDTMINDMEKRLLYVLHRLPELKNMKLGEKIDYLKGLFDEKDKNAEGKGMQSFTSVLKIAEPLIVEKISNQFGFELSNEEKTFSKTIEKINFTIPNLYAVCDLISAGIEDIINNDYDRLKKYQEARNDIISSQTTTELDERRDMLLECFVSTIDNISKLEEYGKKNAIKLAILTQNDSVMNRVLSRLFPSFEIIVVPKADLEYRRKNDPYLYKMIMENNKKIYGTEIPHVLIDDSTANIDAATTAGWEGIYINSVENKTDIESLIIGNQKYKNYH